MKSYFLILIVLQVCPVLGQSEISTTPVKHVKIGEFKIDSLPNSMLLPMFTYAAEKDVKKLESMRKNVAKQKDEKLSAAYGFALYIASPSAYSSDYVRVYPEDSSGLSYFYAIENAGLTPKFMYSIDTIGEIAGSGNSLAIKKMVLGITRSDAGAGELFCECFERVVFAQFDKTIRVISKLDADARKKVYECFDLMSPEQNQLARLYLSKKRLTGKENVVKMEILSR